MLVLLNVIIELSNVEKPKKKKLSNVTNVRSHVILVLLNVIMEPLNVRNNRETTKCDKSSITCDVSTTQYEDGTIKCEKKK